MKNIQIDVAVLGAGTAGLAAYRAAKAAGKTAVIIESGVYGTTCARVGCMPSKLLIAAAEAAHSVDRFEAFGLRLDGAIRVDSAAVMGRVKRERDRFVGLVVEGVEKIPQSDRLMGHAAFSGLHTLLVNSDDQLQNVEISFKTAVIATGSSPQVFPLLREAGDRLIINDDVFDWDVLPDSVAVFGPGVIGLELGQALHRLGVKIHLFGRGGIGAGLSDPSVKTYAEQTFKNEFSIDFDAQVSHIARTEAGVLIHWKNAEGVLSSQTFDYVLAATGRTPNVHDIGIDRTGITLDNKGIPVFDRETLQCGSSGIFIAGDANALVPLLHEAADEGKIAGTNAASFPKINKGLRRTPIAVVFTDPQIAIIGQRLSDIDPHVRLVGEVSFEDQGRSRVMLRNKGILRVYAHAHTGRFLGAEMMGPDAEHLAHLLAWAHQAGMTVATMLDMPFYHPVIEEGLRTALRDVAAKLTARSAVEQVAA
jgi:dihydrolipoamide dehydrogenase